ncbi:hypothetical protein AAFF_G00398790 [Aldrovandia affinis]|uniref:Uncharacterized protein n=1 Tax=Aldrovandia affinis TaxID=143900 RepID=A0AAD7WKN6_9TELE|nr:hypothetical protein AAFF_G00398790 [Aldrovandia affinis]
MGTRFLAFEHITAGFRRLCKSFHSGSIYEGAKERLRGLLEAKAKALAFQALLRELEEGERPTAYFFKASTIAGLRRADGTLAEGLAMLAVAESYYAELFSRQACGGGVPPWRLT